MLGGAAAADLKLKTHIAVLQLKRHLGVTWRTPWHLQHKLLEAMLARAQSRPLLRFVHIDEVYLGKELNAGKPGPGSQHKQALVMALKSDETRQRPR